MEKHKKYYQEQNRPPQISESTQDIINKKKEKCFKQIFRVLDNDEDNQISSNHIEMSTHYSPKVLLGTATPCAETYHNAHTGKYGLVELTERYQGIELPEIQVVDTYDLQRRKMMNGPFSPVLLANVYIPNRIYAIIL